MLHLLRFSFIAVLLNLLLILCTVETSNAQGGAIHVGPAINIERDFRSETGLMLGADYLWMVGQSWGFGTGFGFIRFGPNMEEVGSAFGGFGNPGTRKIEGGGSTQYSLMTFLRFRSSSELDEISFTNTLGVGPNLMIYKDLTAVNGTETRTVEFKDVFAAAISIDVGIDWPIVDENLALTADFAGMVNLFVEDEYRVAALWVSFGVEYRIAPW